jgi:hypothetical protein
MPGNKISYHSPVSQQIIVARLRGTMCGPKKGKTPAEKPGFYFSN